MFKRHRKYADLAVNDENRSYVCIPFIPEIGPQLRRILKKSNITTTFKSAPKLKDILCSRNKTQPHPHKKKGIYKYTCTCSSTATYIGQTNRSFSLRWKEHERAIHNKQWHHSGITQHHENCQKPFDQENFQPIHREKRDENSQKRVAQDRLSSVQFCLYFALLWICRLSSVLPHCTVIFLLFPSRLFLGKYMLI